MGHPVVVEGRLLGQEGPGTPACFSESSGVVLDGLRQDAEGGPDGQQFGGLRFHRQTLIELAKAVRNERKRVLTEPKRMDEHLMSGTFSGDLPTMIPTTGLLHRSSPRAS